MAVSSARLRLSLRATVFLCWVVLATAVPAVVGALASVLGVEVLASAGYVGLVVSVLSVVLVERPRSRSLFAYLEQLRLRLSVETRPAPLTQSHHTKESHP